MAFPVVHGPQPTDGPAPFSSRAKRSGERSERLWAHRGNPVQIALSTLGCGTMSSYSRRYGWNGHREDL